MHLDAYERALTRRALLRRSGLLAGAVAVPSLLAACGDDQPAPQGDGKSLESDSAVFADYGGTVRAARGTAFFRPFEQAVGVRVISADADPSKLQLFAKSNRAEWDLLDTDGWDVIRFAKQGLLDALPADVAQCDLVPEEFRKWAAGGYSASAVIGYGTETGRSPESWADFFDLARFPGKRSLPNFAWMQCEAALLADGVAPEAVYPIDFDRAFAKLDKLRDHLLFYESFGQGMQYLAQGAVAMVLSTNSRVTVLKDQGLPVELVWNQAIHEQWTGAAVPKGAPHQDAAFRLVDFMAQPENQAQFARLTFYGPTNSKALELLDDETLDKLPNSPAHAKVAFPMDMQALSEQLDEYNTRYTEWLARS